MSELVGRNRKTKSPGRGLTVIAASVLVSDIAIFVLKPTNRQHARLVVAFLQSQSQASSVGQRRDKMQ